MGDRLRKVMRGMTTEGMVEEASQDKPLFARWSEGPVTGGMRDGNYTVIAPTGQSAAIVGVGAGGTENWMLLRKRAIEEGIEFEINGHRAGVLHHPRHGFLRSQRIVTIDVHDDLPAELAATLNILDGAFFRARGLAGFASLEKDGHRYLIRFGRQRPRINGQIKERIGIEPVLLYLAFCGSLSMLITS